MEKNSPAPSYHQEKNRGIENLANTPKKFLNQFYNPEKHWTYDEDGRYNEKRGEEIRRDKQAEYNNKQENIYGSDMFNFGDAGNRNTTLSNRHAVEGELNDGRMNIRGANNQALATMDGKVQEARDVFTTPSGGPNETDFRSGGVLQNTAYGQDPRIVQKVPQYEDSSYDVGPEGRVQTGEPMDLAFRLLKSLNPEVEDTPEEEDEEDGMTDAEMDEWEKELEIERREWEISQRSDDPTSPHFYEEGYDEYGHPTDPTDPSNQDDDPDDFLDNYGLRKSVKEGN